MLRYDGKLYRALNPVFAREPFSGQGAALYGGRFNPKGVPAVIEYGAFINVLIQFVIVAFVIFMMVKLINKLRRQQAAEPDATPAAPTATEQLLIEIRDELKARP